MANEPRHPLISYQPLRLLFQLSYTATIIARLPYYAVIALVPPFRPNSRWGAKQTFMTRLMHPMLDITSRIGITETLTLEKGKEGDRFQIVEPSTLDVYKGPLDSKTIKPVTVGGTWFPHAPGPDVTSKTVMFYFHGGAFVQGDGRDASCGHIVKKFLKKGGVDVVFALQYRLSGYGGQNPFPAALQDSVSAYLFLLNEMHIPASQIILSGDSAGGNLATALLRYLYEFGSKIGIPNPKAAVLLSSWVAPLKYDMTGNPQRNTDFVPWTYPAWGAHNYTAGRPDGASDPYITMLGNPFPTPVPIFANAATAEVLLEQITQWVEEMRKIKGNRIELNFEPGGVHDTFLTGELLGFEKEAWDVAAKVGEFVRGL